MNEMNESKIKRLARCIVTNSEKCGQQCLCKSNKLSAEIRDNNKLPLNIIEQAVAEKVFCQCEHPDRRI